MSGLLKNAALKGQMSELSKAALALCLLGHERPAQRKASQQSCLNCDRLPCIDGPRSLMVRPRLAVLHVTDLSPGVLSLI